MEEKETQKALRAARPSFTPGPWEVWEEHARVYAGPATQNTPSTMSGIRGCVAECDEDDWGADEDEGAAIAQANATLIAAAPDLHEALRQIVERLDGDRHFINPDGGAEMLVAALAALAKAEGRAAERSDAHKALSDDSRGTP